MFKGLIAKIRQVMYRMGLLKGIKEATKHKDIAVDSEHYNRVDMWNHLYRGYLEDWHSVTYQTINGRRTRRMDTLDMPKVIAHEMASLVFNEKCRINIDGGVSDDIEEVLSGNDFYKQFQRYLEYGFALGGVVMKVYADQKGVRISYVTADCFIPLSYSNHKINEGVFVNETRRGDKYYTLLEWHTWEGDAYVITNELYQSDVKGELGVKISLKSLYPNLEERTEINNLSHPLFVYTKPNTANNFDMQSPLGISIYANSLGTLKAIDQAFDSFNREFRLGKKRIIVPSEAVRWVVDPQTGERHRYFDADDEVYEAFDFEDGQKIHDNSVEIRVEEHVSAIQALLDLLAMQTGFSAGTFTFDAQGVKTATEVVSENSKTYRTKNSHETIVEEAIKELITSIIEVATLYGFFTATEDYEVNIDFDDSIAEDRDSNAVYYLNLKNGGLISARTALMRILDYTEEQADEEIQRIADENKTATAEAIDFFGRGGRTDDQWNRRRANN